MLILLNEVAHKLTLTSSRILMRNDSVQWIDTENNLPIAEVSWMWCAEINQSYEQVVGPRVILWWLQIAISVTQVAFTVNKSIEAFTAGCHFKLATKRRQIHWKKLIYYY